MCLWFQVSMETEGQSYRHMWVTWYECCKQNSALWECSKCFEPWIYLSSLQNKLVEKEDLVRSGSQAFHKHVTPSFRVNEWKLWDCDWPLFIFGVHTALRYMLQRYWQESCKGFTYMAVGKSIGAVSRTCAVLEQKPERQQSWEVSWVITL